MSVHVKVNLERVDHMLRQGFDIVVVNNTGTIISRHRSWQNARESAVRAGCSEGVKSLRELRKELSKPPPLAEGETWKVSDVRKGDLTVRLMCVSDDFAIGEIVEGKVTFASIDNRIMQRAVGLGTPGDTITLSYALCRFKEKL